jgi:nucleoside-diphosphate-sugar epimerase
MEPKVIAVTGVTGFVGRAIAGELVQAGYRVIGWGRRLPGLAERLPGVHYRVRDLSSASISAADFAGVDLLIHAAAHVHRQRPTQDDLRAFQSINVDASEQIAVQAAEAGIRRLIYLSSVGIYGRSTKGQPLTRSCAVRPVESYAKSKLEGERRVQAAFSGVDREVLIVRLPMVIGAGAPGRFRAMIRWMNHGLPVPVPSRPNRRSVVDVRDVAGFLTKAIRSSVGWGETWLIASQQPISSSEMAAAIARGLGRPCRFVMSPQWVTRYLSKLPIIGRSVSPLFEDFELDYSETMSRFNWSPAFSPTNAIENAVRGLP